VTSPRPQIVERPRLTETLTKVPRELAARTGNGPATSTQHLRQATSCRRCCGCQRQQATKKRQSEQREEPRSPRAPYEAAPGRSGWRSRRVRPHDTVLCGAIGFDWKNQDGASEQQHCQAGRIAGRGAAEQAASAIRHFRCCAKSQSNQSTKKKGRCVTCPFSSRPRSSLVCRPANELSRLKNPRTERPISSFCALPGQDRSLRGPATQGCRAQAQPVAAQRPQSRPNKPNLRVRWDCSRRQAATASNRVRSPESGAAR
jgi:hypothetical protein